jgi:hypothetical protein
MSIQPTAIAWFRLLYELARLLDSDEAGATYSHPSGVGEETIFTFDVAGLRTEVMGIWLDLANLTQNATVRVKQRIDGVNYRTFDHLDWLTTMDDGVYVTGFNVRDNVQVSIQSAVAEGFARDIPYYYLYRTVE